MKELQMAQNLNNKIYALVDYKISTTLNNEYYTFESVIQLKKLQCKSK